MRLKGAVVVLVLMSALAGCGSEAAAPTASFNVGSLGANYLLTAVADQALPATAFAGTDASVRANGGTLALAGDHSYALKVQCVRHFTSGKPEVPFEMVEQGTWAPSKDSKDAVILTPARGSARKATAVGDNLAFTLTVPDASPIEKATKVYRFTKH